MLEAGRMASCRAVKAMLPTTFHKEFHLTGAHFFRGDKIQSNVELPTYNFCEIRRFWKPLCLITEIEKLSNPARLSLWEE
jgi:hypothetical protein